MAIKLSIVIPVFNEQDNVLPLAKEVVDALRGFREPWEIIFVDDGSTDDTWGSICMAAAEFPMVWGIRHSRNAGQSSALWTGFRFCRGEVIATMDGDRQNDPSDLSRLLALLDRFDFVSGDRSHGRRDSVVRRISSVVARVFRRWFLGYRFRDTGCGLRVFRRQVLDSLIPFNGFHRFMPILVADAGWRTIEVPVSHRPRLAGKSKYGVWNRLWRGIYDLIGVCWLLRRRIKAEAITVHPPHRLNDLTNQPH